MSKHRFEHDLEIFGNISLTGTINERDIVSDGTNLDTHIEAISAHGVAEIVGTTESQILTNKTITEASNNVVAKGLHSATTTISVSSSTAPSSGQVLTATSSTTATWQTPSNTTIDINGQTEDSSPDQSSDYILSYDTSSFSNKKVLLKYLLPKYETGTVQTHTDSRTVNDYDGANTEALSITTGIIPAGVYIIHLKWNWLTNNRGDCRLRLSLDDTTEIYSIVYSVDTENISSHEKTLYYTLAAGVHQFDIDHYREESNLGRNSTISNVELHIHQVSAV